jgi:hypothetical protein
MSTIIGIIVIVVIIYIGKKLFLTIYYNATTPGASVSLGLKYWFEDTFLIIPIKKTEVVYDSESSDIGNYRFKENGPGILIGESELHPEKGYTLRSISFPKNVTRLEHITGTPYLIYKITIGANVTFECVTKSNSCNRYESEIYLSPFDTYFKNKYYKHHGIIYSGKLTHFIEDYEKHSKKAGIYVFHGKIIRQYTQIQGNKENFYEWKGQWIRREGS